MAANITRSLQRAQARAQAVESHEAPTKLCAVDVHVAYMLLIVEEVELR